MNQDDKTIQFIEKARRIHSDKYDYSKVEYVNANTKVCIICPKHGEFWQIPRRHIQGSNCNKCTHHYTRTTTEFIQEAKKVHGDKYDYSKTEYIDTNTKVCILCPIHGEFWQLPPNHLKGKGCRKCGGTHPLSQDEFITKAQELHKNKYDYSKVTYTKCNQKVCIICPTHGEFMQNANSHLRGVGCPKCNQSHLEREVLAILSENVDDFIIQKKFDWLGKQSLDFYIPQYNIAIECQGKQHFGLGGWSNKFDFQKLQELDLRKYNLCKEHNIKLLYYTHEDFEEFLGESLVKNKNELIERIKEC